MVEPSQPPSLIGSVEGTPIHRDQGWQGRIQEMHTAKINTWRQKMAPKMPYRAEAVMIESENTWHL